MSDPTQNPDETPTASGESASTASEQQPETATHDTTDASATPSTPDTTPDASPADAPTPADAQPTEPVAPIAPPAPTAAPIAGPDPTLPRPEGHQPTLTYPTAPIPDPAVATAPGTTGAPTATKERRRSIAVPVVIALVAGAVVGGGSAAGVSVLMNHDSSAQQGSSANPQTITINNSGDVNAVTAIAKKAGPSVVTINVTAGQEGGTGSGVILSDDNGTAYVLTNTHVVTLDGASANGSVEVTTYDGKLYKASVVGTDPIVDLAVIKFSATDLTPIEWGDSSKINVGDRVVAIGAPLGLANTVTDGIVSALNRSIQIASSAAPNGSSGGDQSNGGGSPYNFWNFGNGNGDGSGSSGQSTQQSEISLPVIQTDAAINPGNSGGALVDDSGKLVGINVAIASTGSTDSSGQSGSIGVGFAVPADLAKRIATEIQQNGKGTHGLLGASVTDATADKSSTVGALIDSVTSGGAAAKAGLQKGDVVTKVGDIPITSSTDLTAQVRALAAGANTQITYVRAGKAATTDVTLGTLTS
jgi:putative serine protease PepD